MIVLASASPRRRDILSELGVDFKIITSDTDESSDEKNPERLTEELARRKGLAVYEKLLREPCEGVDAKNAIIISADTLVACDGKILGKPENEEDALNMLRMLCGREHSVSSGVAITIGGVTRSAVCTTRVFVEDVPHERLVEYVKSGEPMDKAGAYAIQGGFSLWIKKIDGCYFNVVGLPINTLAKLYFECTGEYLS